ncbi:hypothetical protein ABPG72_020142 [Tetrahymena utriculariae]
MEIENQSSDSNKSNRINEDERWQIIGYFKCCQNQQQTADYFGISQSSVSRLLQKYDFTNDVINFKCSGREKIIGLDEQEVIKDMVKDDRFVTSQKIADTLGVSYKTVQKEMKSIGMKFSVPKEIPLLNSSHIQKRLEHAKLFKDRRIDDIIFTDESYFQLFRNKIGVWHFEDDPNLVCKPQSRICLMGYAAISWKGKSEIYVYEQGFKINSQAYCEILNEILLPFANKVYAQQRKTRKSIEQSKWLLLQDNAPCHRSKETKDYLVQNSIETIAHPPNSPDLNPIEQIWAILKRRVEKQQPKNANQLKETIVNEWNQIEQSIIQSQFEELYHNTQENLNNQQYLYKLQRQKRLKETIIQSQKMDFEDDFTEFIQKCYKSVPSKWKQVIESQGGPIEC